MTSDKELSKKAILGPILGSVIYTLGLYKKLRTLLESTIGNDKSLK